MTLRLVLLLWALVISSRQGGLDEVSKLQFAAHLVHWKKQCSGSQSLLKNKKHGTRTENTRVSQVIRVTIVLRNYCFAYTQMKVWAGLLLNLFVTAGPGEKP